MSKANLIHSNMNVKQYSFSEMNRKMVINVADGRELGHVCDMIFNSCGGVLGFVVPGKKSFFKSITSSDTIFIPWNRIVKIGSDVMLVELIGNCAGTLNVDNSQNAQQQQSEYAQYSQQPTGQTVYHTNNALNTQNGHCMQNGDNMSSPSNDLNY